MKINEISQGRLANVSLSSKLNNGVKENIIKSAVSESEQVNECFNEMGMQNAVERLNNFLKEDSTHIEYEKHDKFNEYVVKIIDDKTKQVIKEIPPKKILDMVAKMCEMVGIIIDKKA